MLQQFVPLYDLCYSKAILDEHFVPPGGQGHGYVCYGITSRLLKALTKGFTCRKDQCNATYVSLNSKTKLPTCPVHFAKGHTFLLKTSDF